MADPQYNAQADYGLDWSGIQQGSEAYGVSGTLPYRVYMCGPVWSEGPAEKGREELGRIVRFTDGKDILVFWGFLGAGRKLYNVAAAIQKGGF